MKHYIIAFKRWYELREKREKLLTFGLGLILIYGIFSFLLIMPIENNKDVLEIETKLFQSKITALKIEIDALAALSISDVYKRWLVDSKKFNTSQDKYRSILKSASNKQWQEIIRTILTSQKNVTLTQIKNLPEALYNPFNIESMKTGIYQQQFHLVVMSNYFDTVNYLKYLEKVLPNIHWDRLQYHVTQYPLANVEMEFSVLYEKN